MHKKIIRLGCPCGCTTWLPWYDDPECIRHQPSTGPYTAVDMPLPDALSLGELLDQVRQILARNGMTL